MHEHGSQHFLQIFMSMASKRICQCKQCSGKAGVSQAGSYEEYIEELRRKYPCSEFKAGFPFVGGGDEALLQRLYEACHGKPPSGYNNWEAYWRTTVGRPGPSPGACFSADFIHLFP